MLSKALWALAQQGGRSFAASLAHAATGCSAAASTGAARSGHQGLHSLTTALSANLPSSSTAGLTAWKHSNAATHGLRYRTFSSDSSAASARSLLENTAKAQMQKLQAKAAHHDEAPPTILHRIFGALADTAIISLGGMLLFSGYYTVAYRDINDLEKALYDAKQSLKATAPPAPPPDAAPGPGAAPVAAAPAGVQPAAIWPLTAAWVAVMDRYLGVRRYVERAVKEYQDPTYDKLLPDLAPELRGKVKTLVLDLDDLLVHKEWTRQSGWKVYKRPGVQDFIVEMGGYYEVVVFTDGTALYADPIITKLDPQRMIMYRLYRPETQYHEGKHVRDLSKLNRDMSQVLMISANPDAWAFQPENTLKLKAWTKDTSDTTLLDLIPMLQLIATKGVRDVRDVVRSYDGEDDIPKAFKARMSQVAQQQQQKPKQRGLLTLAK